MAKTEWVISEDEFGIYKSRVNEHGITETLTEYKQKWYDENPSPDPEPQTPTTEEKIEALEQDKFILQLALAESIEKQEIDKINNQLAMAELIETLTIKGVL